MRDDADFVAERELEINAAPLGATRIDLAHADAQRLVRLAADGVRFRELRANHRHLQPARTPTEQPGEGSPHPDESKRS